MLSEAYGQWRVGGRSKGMHTYNGGRSGREFQRNTGEKYTRETDGKRTYSCRVLKQKKKVAPEKASSGRTQ